MNRHILTNINIGRVMIYLILFFFALIYLAPLYVMFTTSLKDIEEIRSGNLMALPLDPTFYLGRKLGHQPAQVANVKVWPHIFGTVFGLYFRQS